MNEYEIAKEDLATLLSLVRTGTSTGAWLGYTQSVELATQALKEKQEYEAYNEVLRAEYGDCPPLKVIVDAFINFMEEGQDEPLSGFRILTNQDKTDYEEWKAEQQERENPRPLTLEELKKRHKEPVFLDAICIDDQRWIICGSECKKGLFYFGNYGEFPISSYGIDWICYGHKPKEI